MNAKPDKIRHWVFIGIFALAITLPLFQSISGFVPNPNLTENRELAPPPNLEGRIRLKRLREEFDGYYADNFGFRPHLISLYDRINIDLFKHSNRVLFGEADWLFLKNKFDSSGAVAKSIIDDLCIRSLITENELETWISALVANWNQLRSRGIDYYFVIVPNKHSVHKEYLPKYLQCANEKTSLDILLERIAQEHSSFPIIDFRAGMRQDVSAGQLLYYRTDTHWNAIGILNGYEQMYRVISTKNNIRYAAGKSSVKLLSQIKRGGDLASMIGKGDSEQEQVVGLKLVDNTAKRTASPFRSLISNPRRQPETWSMREREAASAMIFHDSFFATEIRKLFVNTFSETTFIWKVHQDIDFRLVDKIKPNIVVHELVERNLLRKYF